MEKEFSTQTGLEMLTSGRIALIRREGNKVFVRTVGREEDYDGEGVKLRPGDQIVFPPGALVIDSRDIDAQSTPGLGGYAPVANTVWTWYRIVSEELGFFLFFFSVARRIDAAHALWALAIQEREKAHGEGSIPRRTGFFNALATAEVAIIALHRGITMLYSLIDKFCLKLEIPDRVQKVRPIVEQMRHAFEHIDDRAQGKVGRSKKELHPDALSIFNQPDFVESAILRYREYSLNFEKDILSALLECREVIMNAIDARVAINARDNKMVGNE